MSIVRAVGAMLLMSTAPATSAQTPATQRVAATTFIAATEIANAIPRSDSQAVVDRTLRLVGVDSEYNVAVSIVRRTRGQGATPADALSHDEITEVYQILEGRGIMVTGGTLDGARPLPADGPVVRNLVGPSLRGRSIVGGARRAVGPGDVIVIPPRTPHGFAELSTPEIRYLLVRMDPHRVLQPQ